MGHESKKNLVVGIEIGTSKITVLIGEILLNSNINIIGIGNSSSNGIKNGGINDLDSVIKCINVAINQAETMANCQISSLYLSLSGKNINCQNELGIVPIAEKEVTQYDVDSVIHTARSVRIQDDYRILHVVPQEYAIDGQEGIKNPIGLSGIRMQAKVHLITCHNDTVKNIIKAIEKCSIKVDQLIFAGLASSLAVLNDDERELGACVIDIGGGTMDIAIYISGALFHTKVIPYAGNIVTHDIAYAFGITLANAESIKINHGCALSSLVNKNENIEVEGLGGIPSRILLRQTLAEVIEPRYKELLNFANHEIKKTQHELSQQGIKNYLAAGVILTGGASKIEGLTECAKNIFNTQVRIGHPFNITGLTDYINEPSYSTTIGLLHYAKEFNLNNDNKISKKVSMGNWFKKINNWLKKEF